MAVYLLHFDQPFKHAKHYCGWASNVEARLAHHEHGTGANLLKHCRMAGIGWVLARLWPEGDKTFERRVKRQGGLARVCPVCRSESSCPPLPKLSSVDESMAL